MPPRTNAYLVTGGHGVLGSYRDGSSRSYARVDRERLGSEAAAQELETKQRRERQRKHMRIIRKGHDEDDIAMDKKESKDERQQRLWSLLEDQRIADLLEEQKWAYDDHDRELAGFEERKLVETEKLRKMAERERKRLHEQFERCWTAFEKTHYGQILTDNPDLSEHLKRMLEHVFK